MCKRYLDFDVLNALRSLLQLFLYQDMRPGARKLKCNSSNFLNRYLIFEFDKKYGVRLRIAKSQTQDS